MKLALYVILIACLAGFTACEEEKPLPPIEQATPEAAVSQTPVY